MNSTLELYRTRVMKPEQNWCFDNMTKFLAAYTTEYKKITDYQFLRPELSMSIKIDRTQNDSLLSNTRWDYLKVTINNSIYYFFITHIIQVSQNTLRLELKMDVLNTFQFSSTALSQGGNKYYLSKKSLITREHKNRFKIDGVLYNNQALTDETRQERTDFFDGNWSEDLTPTPIFSINRDEILNFVIDNSTIGMSLHQIDPVETGLKLVLSDGTIKSCYGIRFTYLNVRLLDKNNNITETISWDSITTWFGIQGNYQGTAPFTKYENNAGDYDLFFFGGYPLSQKYTMRKFIDSHRIVDKYQEGLDVVLFKNLTETDLLDDDKYFNWTMFYIANNAVVQNPSDTAALYVNPVKLNFVKDITISVSSSSAKRVTISPQYKYIKNYSNMREYIYILTSELSNTAYIELPDGTQITKSNIETENPANIGICFSKINDTSASFDSCFYMRAYTRGTQVATNISYFIAYDIDEMEEGAGLSFNLAEYHKNKVYIGSAATTESGTITTWDSLDLTNPKLIKAIALPYSPIDWIVGKSGISIPDGYSLNTDFNSLEISSTQKLDLSRQLKFEDVNPFSVLNKPIGYEALFYNTPRNIEWESKLFHSDFYLPKFVYDSFTFPFYLEDIDVDTYKEQYAFSSFIVTYAVSKNMLSKFSYSNLMS